MIEAHAWEKMSAAVARSMTADEARPGSVAAVNGALNTSTQQRRARPATEVTDLLVLRGGLRKDHPGVSGTPACRRTSRRCLTPLHPSPRMDEAIVWDRARV